MFEDGRIEAGESQGFGHYAIDFYAYHGKIKRLWVKELAPGARATLCATELPESIPPEALSCAHRPKSQTGKTIGYTLNLWNKLLVYTEHTQMEIDNNLIVEAKHR